MDDWDSKLAHHALSFFSLALSSPLSLRFLSLVPSPLPSLSVVAHMQLSPLSPPLAVRILHPSHAISHVAVSSSPPSFLAFRSSPSPPLHPSFPVAFRGPQALYICCPFLLSFPSHPQNLTRRASVPHSPSRRRCHVCRPLLDARHAHST